MDIGTDGEDLDFVPDTGGRGRPEESTELEDLCLVVVVGLRLSGGGLGLGLGVGDEVEPDEVDIGVGLDGGVTKLNSAGDDGLLESMDARLSGEVGTAAGLVPVE